MSAVPCKKDKLARNSLANEKWAKWADSARESIFRPIFRSRGYCSVGEGGGWGFRDDMAARLGLSFDDE